MRLAVLLSLIAAGLLVTALVDASGTWAAAAGAICLTMAAVVCAIAMEDSAPLPARDDPADRS